jgi:hypothetical protein
VALLAGAGCGGGSARTHQQERRSASAAFAATIEQRLTGAGYAVEPQPFAIATGKPGTTSGTQGIVIPRSGPIPDQALVSEIPFIEEPSFVLTLRVFVFESPAEARRFSQTTVATCAPRRSECVHRVVGPVVYVGSTDDGRAGTHVRAFDRVVGVALNPAPAAS